MCMCVTQREREREISSNFNIYMEIQNANNSQDSLLGKKKEGNFVWPDVKTYCKITIAKRV